MALDVVSAREAARRIGKNERTVRRWIVKDAGLTADKQRLPGADIDEHTGEFRVPVAALRPYLPARVERANGTVVGTATGEVTVPDELADGPATPAEVAAEMFNVATVLPREHMVSVPLTLLLDLQARCARAEALLELWPPSNPEPSNPERLFELEQQRRSEREGDGLSSACRNTQHSRCKGRRYFGRAPCECRCHVVEARE